MAKQSLTNEARIQNQGKIVSSPSGMDKAEQFHVNHTLILELEHTLIPHTKINSKWLKNLNIREDIIKLLEEIIGETFPDIKHWKVFLGQSPKAIEWKNKNKPMGANQAHKHLHSNGKL